MRFLEVLLFSLIVEFGDARRDPRHVGRKIAEKVAEGEREWRLPVNTPRVQPQTVERDGRTMIPQTEGIKKFVVDGTKIPDVDFDIGESYAGLLPVSSAPDAGQLYFWFFPTTNPNGTEDLTIWLNGGPGCSSLEGLLQENGPFIWQYGTFKPVKNPWTWVNLTNMIWVEQPVGTGFSQGASTETSQEQVAASFLGFLKNFQDTFNFKNKKIYIAGESYAGMYVPYIADAMFNSNDTTHFDVQGTMIYDPSINSDPVMQEIPAVQYVKAFDSFFNLNDTYMAELSQRADKCGYTDFLNKNLVYPPVGKMTPPPPRKGRDCVIWNDIKNAAQRFNPCFNMYDISTTCPLLWDVLGFPGSFEYLPAGAQIYFNRTDVQKAINAPLGPWTECGDVALDKDTSLPSGLTVLPSVIERSKRTIIAHGNLDYILLKEGSLLTIQNMTWNGKQGFQKEPKADFYVPYHRELAAGSIAGSGNLGVTHTERGLTWVEVFMSGHMVPQYQPSAAYRQMEFLLGRIESLGEVSGFTTQADVPQAGAAAVKSQGFGTNGTVVAGGVKMDSLFGR